ncbi:MAG: hypothetical protein HY763_09880 [Planctomycetes bacterium]|nr:hypothetical protein [Planctomycetota bacterium]
MTRWMVYLVFLAAAAASPAQTPAATDPPVKVEAPKPADAAPKDATTPTTPELTDPKEILKRADAAMKQVSAVHYKGVFQGTGHMVPLAPVVKGTALISGKATGGFDRFRFEVEARMPNDDVARKFTAGSDGEIHFLIDRDKKIIHAGVDSKVTGPRGRLGQAIGLPEFSHPRPFDDELAATEVERRSDDKVGGEECYVVRVKTSGVKGTAIWHISKRDLLPRRLNRIVELPNGDQGTMEWIITDLVVNPIMTGAEFTPGTLEGYTTSSAPAP